jgi:hypothetical protein
MIADPSVSRRKFEREVAAALAHKPFHEQGVWILRAEYPTVFAVLITTLNVPIWRGILCGVHINFTDFDVRPPSLKFVDPFNERPLNYNECWKFTRLNLKPPLPGDTAGPQQYEAVPLLQAFDINNPFLCLPGVREYHDSSAHTGDSWFLHRRKNMLIYILTILQQFGSSSASLQVQFVQAINPSIQK